MKTKTKLFVTAIIAVMIGTTLAPALPAQSQPDMKKMEQLMKEAEEISRRISAERRQATAQEIRRLGEIQQEIAHAQSGGGAIQPPPRLPGKTAGWPAARLRECGLPNLRQPAGIQPSYDPGADYDLTVYMTGATEATLQEVKRQIETALGKPMTERTVSHYVLQIAAGTRTAGARWVNLKLEGNQLSLEFHQSTG